MQRRWILFIITSSLFLISQFYRASNAVIAPLLMRDLSLDAEELGLMSASFFYAFALMQIPLGILLDRLGPRRTMTVLSLFAVLGAVLFAWADSFSSGVIGRILLGVGMACNLMGTLKLLTTWFKPAIFATLSGMVLSIGTLGSMAAATPFVLLVHGTGWRPAFTLIAGINLVLILVFYRVVRDRPPAETDTSSPPPVELKMEDILAGLHVLFTQKDYWIISCGSFFRYGVFAAVQTLWAGPYLINAMGLSPMAAGNVIFLLNIGLIVGGPVWGSLSDRVIKSHKGVVTASLLLFSGSILAMAFLPEGVGLPILIFLFFCFGFSAGTANVFYAHIKDLMPLELSGVAMTGVNFFTMLGAAVFLQGLGSLMQRIYPEAALGISAFRCAFLLCALLLLAAAILYLFTRDAGGNKK